MLENITEDERHIIRHFVDNGMGDRMLHFPFMGWGHLIAKTVWQWLWRNPLDNVHSDEDGDFSEVERIKQSGALIIGTYDRFSYGESKAFIELINSHMLRKDETEVTFVEGTRHVYTKRKQMLADIILSLVLKWS